MKTLIQHASGKDARSLLEIIEPLHAKRCKKHGWNYVCSYVAHPTDPSGKSTRFALMEESIISDPGGMTVCLDGTDAVWWRDEQLAEAFLECGGKWDVGMVAGRPGSPLMNSGAIYLRNTQAALDFCRRCLLWQDRPGYEDQAVTEEARVGVSFAHLPIWWNEWPSSGGSYPIGAPFRETVVRALHGCNLEQKVRGVINLVKTAQFVKKGGK